MEFSVVESLTLLRATVGYLGEQANPPWWPTDFFSTFSSSFLAPIFPRTQMLARCNGVTEAATLLHDKRIGIGRVFHLFRLPEGMEQTIQHALHTKEVILHIEENTSDYAVALACLHSLAGRQEVFDNVGPIHLGDATHMYTHVSWSIVAAHYATAFNSHGPQRFPYFTGRIT